MTTLAFGFGFSLLNNPPGNTGAESCLSPQFYAKLDNQATNGWLLIYLLFCLAYNILLLVGILHQYSAVSNKEACIAEWKKQDSLLKETYTEEKVETAIDYTSSLFKFLAFRQVLGNFVWDFFIMYFYVPAYLWNFYMSCFSSWGWCDKNGEYNT